MPRSTIAIWTAFISIISLRMCVYNINLVEIVHEGHLKGFPDLNYKEMVPVFQILSHFSIFNIHTAVVQFPFIFAERLFQTIMDKIVDTFHLVTTLKRGEGVEITKLEIVECLYYFCP